MRCALNIIISTLSRHIFQFLPYYKKLENHKKVGAKSAMPPRLWWGAPTRFVAALRKAQTEKTWVFSALNRQSSRSPGDSTILGKVWGLWSLLVSHGVCVDQQLYSLHASFNPDAGFWSGKVGEPVFTSEVTYTSSTRLSGSWWRRTDPTLSLCR